MVALDTHRQSQASGLARSSPGATITQVNLLQPGAAGASNQCGTRASQAVGEADWIEATRLRP